MQIAVIKQQLPAVAGVESHRVLAERLGAKTVAAKQLDRLQRRPVVLLNPAFPLMSAESLQRAKTFSPPFAMVANGACGAVILGEPGDFVGFGRSPNPSENLPAAETADINDPRQRILIEAEVQRLLREKHGVNVFFHDVGRVRLSWDTEFGRNVEVASDVWFGDNVKVGDDVVIHSFCHLSGCRLLKGAQVGPFSHIRGADTELGQGAFVGSFVNVKNSKLGRGSKVAHMSYVGDSTLGEEVKLGAGSVTCNYDGAKKHRTEIGDRSIIGCNSSLVAPVKVGSEVTVGAGSVITEDVPDKHLALERGGQKNLPKRSRSPEK